MISIHAPLTGSDIPRGVGRPQRCISIHAPLTGSDQSGAVFRFLGLHFNPRSPYGERQPGHLRAAAPYLISIHAPLTGSDLYQFAATAGISRISIHAPLTGSDIVDAGGGLEKLDFNPRSPYGERPQSDAGHPANHGFQSTLPLRGATISLGL